MNSLKQTINQIWEIPIFYKFLQATLAGGGHEVIKKYLKKSIPKNANRILDQGCGTGEYSLLFGKRYTGIDNNPDYIEHAKGMYPGTFVCGTATKMGLKDNFYDIVFAVGLHHHLTDSEAKKAILESLRVVKRGGRVLIVDAMLPKNKLNFVGYILRKMDRGGYVRETSHTLKLLPGKVDYNLKILSSFPFDYIVLELKK